MIHNACCCGGGAARKTTLAELAEGSIIRLAEGDSLARFIVAKHDYESGLNGTGRTLVVRKDCYSSLQWGPFNNAYASSKIDGWLNGDYKALLDTKIQSAIGTTKFRYTPGNGNTTIGTLKRSIFLLSLYELGITDGSANKEGHTLGIAKDLRIAYINGSAVDWWTRSPYKNNSTNVFYIQRDGTAPTNASSYTFGSRPAFTLPSTIDVNELWIII